MAPAAISLWILVLLVVVALAFDFMNGFHDGANSISTIVATGALTPKQAVLFAAAFNFVALWVFHLKVAATIVDAIRRSHPGFSSAQLADAGWLRDKLAALHVATSPQMGLGALQLALAPPGVAVAV